MNLQKKVLFGITGILFFMIAANTAVLTFVSTSKYKGAILAKTTSEGEALQKELTKVLSLGVSLDTIEGMNDKLDELMARDNAIGYAEIIDSSGKILFHDKQNKDGLSLGSDILAHAASADKMLSQSTSSFYHLSFPLTSAEGKRIAALFIGLKSEAVNAQLYTLLGWALGISAVTFLLSIALIYGSTSRFITSPILAMEKAAERIASGDLTSTVAVKGKDEIASLGNAINRMAYNLKDMLAKVRNITDSVTSVTEHIVTSSRGVQKVADVQKKVIEETAGAIAEMNQSVAGVATSAQSLSESAENTSSAIFQMSRAIEGVSDSADIFDESARDTAASVEEMVSNIKQITGSLEALSSSSGEVASSLFEVNTAVREVEDHASRSVELAEKVMSDASGKGMTAIGAATEGIEHIKSSVDALSRVINALGKRSEDIGKILTVIDEVTDMTTLLSLNAAILAAQAGEHGRAFSVVADQIKSLAERTSSSTREIAELIKSVQDDARSSVEMTASGLQTVESGIRLVRDVNAALTEIVESSRVSTEMSRAIRRATSEQSEVIGKITKAIDEMSQTVENISLALQEQGRGSRFIIEASEKVKDSSSNVKRALGEQRSGTKQIGKAAENITEKAEQIAKATGKQQQKSTEIVQGMERVQTTTGTLIDSSEEMSSAINSLQEEARRLLQELKRFEV
ncbi:MAG: methyl-accepting chemotaxis protein [Thermodesulfovibrionales bacterium]|jgi:methyl-accepting chemotaxis protein